MDIRENAIESRIFGGPVVELSGIEAADDIAAALAQHRPAYAVAKVPVEQLDVIQRLEDLGFRFVETQLRLTFTLKKPFDVGAFPYRFERVESEAALEEVLAIARDTFTDDRWFVDPALPNGRALSSARYEAYVRESFARADERVYRLIENGTGRTAALKTHRLLGNGEALMLLGGVHRDLKDAGVAPIAAYHEYNQLLRDGVKRITTHVSARNYPIINLEIRSLGYRLAQTFVVLRKLP